MSYELATHGFSAVEVERASIQARVKSAIEQAANILASAEILTRGMGLPHCNKRWQPGREALNQARENLARSHALPWADKQQLLLLAQMNAIRAFDAIAEAIPQR